MPRDSTLLTWIGAVLVTVAAPSVVTWMPILPAVMLPPVCFTMTGALSCDWASMPIFVAVMTDWESSSTDVPFAAEPPRAARPFELVVVPWAFTTVPAAEMRVMLPRPSPAFQATAPIPPCVVIVPALKLTVALPFPWAWAVSPWESMWVLLLTIVPPFMLSVALPGPLVPTMTAALVITPLVVSVPLCKLIVALPVLSGSFSVMRIALAAVPPFVVMSAELVTVVLAGPVPRPRPGTQMPAAWSPWVLIVPVLSMMTVPPVASASMPRALKPFVEMVALLLIVAPLSEPANTP